MRNILFVFFLLTQTSLLAQLSPEVGLLNGTVLHPRLIERKTPLLKKPYLILDDEQRLELEEIDYYQTSSGYFVVRSVDWNRYQEMERIENGDIKLYTYSKVVQSAPIMGPNGMMTGGGSSVQHFYYYEKNGRLNIMNLMNLKMDIPRGTKAYAELEQIAKKKGIRWGLWIGGGLLTLIGLNNMTAEYNAQGPPYDDVQMKANGLFVVGLATMLVPFFISPNPHGSMIHAIKVHNLNSQSE